MQLIWLRAFVALAEQMNFSDAADEIFVSQSSISKYIRSIEIETSVVLIDRSTRKIRLTAAGKELYSHAAEIVKSYDVMMRSMQEFKQPSNNLRVMAVPATNIYGYFSLFFQFSKDNPDINFNMQEIEMSAALRALKNNDADCAVVRTNLVDSRLGYRELRFNSEEMVFLCNQNHPYAHRKTISLEEAIQEKLVLQKFALDEISLLIDKYLPMKVPNTVATVTQNSVIYNYLQSGLGSTIISRSFAKLIDSRHELCIVPIQESPQLTLGMLYKDGELSKPCNRLVSFLSESIANQTLILPM